jgi:plasmid stability protein
MGVAITIRNVPEEVRDELATRAARSGRSLQEYLMLQLIELTSTPAVEDVIAGARRRARAVGRALSAESILASRDADRR